MRRTVAQPLATALLAGVLLSGALAPAGHAQPSAAPPHAWLFGTWTGGLFPAPSGLTAQACLAQPVVIFTRDVVLRASLTDPQYTQALISTARSVPGGTEFSFAPSAPASGGLLGLAAPAARGFGCEDPNLLHVQKRGENEIAFPGCADFPNPLVRCPAR